MLFYKLNKKKDINHAVLFKKNTLILNHFRYLTRFILNNGTEKINILRESLHNDNI